MKAKYTLITIIVLIFLFSSFTGPTNKLEGTWELVSGKIILPDTTIVMPQTQFGHAIKVFNKTHFATIHQDTTKKELYGNAGTYILTEDTYTENLEFASGIKNIGKTLSYTSTIEGNQWTLSGPIKKSDEEVPEWKLHEVWKRIK